MAMVTMITGMTRITGLTGINGMTMTTRVTRMTRVTGVAWITGMPGITGMLNCQRFEPRSRLVGTKCRLNMIIQVIVVLNRTVVDND